MTPRLMEGSEAIAEAMIAAGCRFFAGYPMTPFTEVLEHMAKRLPDGRRRVHERRERARGGRHGVGRGGHRHPRRHRLDRPGPVADAGVASPRSTLAQLPLVVLNMARAQGDYYQATRGGGHGDYRTPRARAHATSARRSSSSQLAFHLADTLAQPGARLRRLLPRPHLRSRSTSSRSTSARCPPKDWALDGSTERHRRGPSSSRRSATPSSATTSATTWPSYYDRVRGADARQMIDGIEPLAEIGRLRRRRGRRRRLRHAGKYVRYAVDRAARARATGSAASGRSRCSRSPTTAIARRRRRGRGWSRCTRTTRAR